MTPDERARLARTALPARWVVVYGLGLFAMATVLGSALPVILVWSGHLSPSRPTQLVDLVLRLETAWLALCAAGALSVGGWERAVARGSLRRRTATEPIEAIATCYVQTGRWLRPAGVILVTATHLEVVVRRERHAVHDLRWPLAEVDGVVRETDRLAWISSVGDMQGRIVLSRGSECRSLSVVRRGAFLGLLCPAWDRARAGDGTEVRG